GYFFVPPRHSSLLGRSSSGNHGPRFPYRIVEEFSTNRPRRRRFGCRAYTATVLRAWPTTHPDRPYAVRVSFADRAFSSACPHDAVQSSTISKEGRQLPGSWRMRSSRYCSSGPCARNIGKKKRL